MYPLVVLDIASHVQHSGQLTATLCMLSAFQQIHNAYCHKDMQKMLSGVGLQFLHIECFPQVRSSGCLCRKSESWRRTIAESDKL
jgi:hypothetical protein